MRVLRGDQEALELWSKTRAWVISGQRKTLSRLGVRFDEVIFESDFLPRGRRADQPRPRRRHPDPPLRRRDGDVRDRARGARGDAAGPRRRAADPAHAGARLLGGGAGARRRRLAPGLRQRVGLPRHLPAPADRRARGENGNGNGSASGGGPPTYDVFHGMVARGRESITSSKEGALLIDELDEWVDGARSPPIRERAAVRDRHPAPERIAAQVALGYFLLQPNSKRVEFEPAEAAPRRQGKPRLGPGAGRSPPRRRGRRSAVAAASDPDYRFAVVQSEMYRRHLRRRGRDLRLTAAGPLPLPLRPLVPRGGALAARSTASVAGGARRRAPRPRAGGGAMRTLLVDNHDSYTYNVFHLLAAASGEEPVVVNNDAVSWSVLSRSDFDAIVLSPGPGRPERWHDFGVCRDILRYSEIPVLGICLGHQGIGNLLHGGVSRAPMAMHGRLSRSPPRRHRPLRGRAAGLLGRPLPLARDHQPDGAAGPRDRLVGGRRGDGHRPHERPMWGVQFHPESIATEHGLPIARNFYALAERQRRAATRRGAGRRAADRTGRPARGHQGPSARGAEGGGCSCWCGRSRGRRRRSSSTNGSSAAPRTRSGSTAPTRRPGSAQSSYLGTSAGRGQRRCSNTTSTPGGSGCGAAGATSVEHGSIFDLLDRELARQRDRAAGGGARAGWSAATSATSATS